MDNVRTQWTQHPPTSSTLLSHGTLSAVSLIAPGIAPAIGGALLTVGDWRTIFWFLTVVGLAMTMAAALGLPETLSYRHPGGLRQLGRRTRELLGDRRFRSPVLIQCLTTAGFFVYIGGSSFVLQDGLGVSRRTYPLVFTGNALAMVASSVLFRVLVGRVGAIPLRRCAMVVQTSAVAALFASAVLAAGRRLSGTASALGGGLPFLAGSLTTPLTGAFGSQTGLTMAGCMIVPFTLAAGIAIALRSAALEPAVDVPEPELAFA